MPKSSNVILALISSLLLCSTLFFLLPASVYSGGNESEFTWPISRLLAEMWPWAAGVVAVSTLVGMAPGGMGRAWAVLLAALAAISVLHGVFLFVPLPVLDGLSDIKTSSTLISTLDLVFMAAIFLAALVVSWRTPSWVSLQLGFVALVSLLYAAFIVSTDSKQVPDSAEDASLYSFSRDKNALIVLLDGMQSDVFEDVYSKAKLDGFTYFPDTAGVSPTTFLAMPTIHSGQFYDGKRSIKDIYADWVVENSFMADLARAGYSSQVINPILSRCPEGTSYCETDGTLLSGPITQRRVEAARLFDVSLLRVVPVVFRDVVYNDGRWLVSNAVKKADESHFAVEGSQVLRRMAENISTYSDKPTVKFLHLFSTHLPVVINQRCEFVGETVGFSRAAFSDQVGCALAAVSDLFYSMKRAGVYDNTAIVLMADHGTSGLDNARFESSDARISATLVGIANPTLAFKPIRATGQMITSPNSMSLADIAGFVCEQVKDCSAPERGERIFNRYTWDAAYWRAEALPDLTRFEVIGPVWRESSWRKVGEAGENQDGQRISRQ